MQPKQYFMKILILGMDGYIGWPLALHQLVIGNEIDLEL